MRRFLVVLLIFVVWFSCAGPLRATPGLHGSSGLIRIPTAYTLSQGEVDAAVDMYWLRRAGSLPDVRFIHSRLVTGLLEEGDHGVELGLHRVDITDAPGSATAITGKYRFPGKLQLGALALGGRVNVAGPSQNTIYVVGSTNAAKVFAVHYGLGLNFSTAQGLFSLGGGKDRNLQSDHLYAMFGAEMDLWDTVKVNADYNGDTVAYGVNWYPVESLVVSVFWIGSGEMERAYDGHNGLGFGVTAQF